MMMYMLLAVVLTTCFISVELFSWPPPPEWTDKARMARYLVHNADWGIVAAVAPDYQYMPFGTVQSFADGTIENSSGTPYFYLSFVSDTFHNIKYNNSVSMTISLDQSLYCKQRGVDTEDPTCSRVTLFGQMFQVKNEKEKNFAETALFTRHPAMKNWPSSHGWNFFKLNVTGVFLLDYYGGASHISLHDYFSTKP